MPTIKKNLPDTSNITVSKEMRDYSDDPFFKKKLEDAKAFLKKNGLYKKLTQPKKEKK